MTNEQKLVVDGLKYCATHELCEGCPAKDTCYPRDDMLIGLAVDMIVQMAADLEELRQERDAAVRDLKHKSFGCEKCKHYMIASGKMCDLPIGERKHSFGCWEWRGPCAENGGVESSV